jgi:3-oxoacyl-[acyl-carrier protein] reductase
MARYSEYGIEGRTAVITGAGSGIGEACAVELAKCGAKVALFGRRTAAIEKTRSACLTHTGETDVLALSTDVRDRRAVNANVARVIETFGGIDILINNAGIESRLEQGQTFADLFETLTPETYLEFFEIHALGHYLMNLAALPSMKQKRYGRIVNVTSVTGMNGGYSTPAYTASKAAAICQTKSFARHCGPYNITVNAIAPGMVDTPMKIASTPEEFAFVTGKTPLGRVALPIDIARAVLFFAQEHLFVTGQTLIVDGGSQIF